MESKVAYENIELNLKATELRLGLPGTHDSQEASLFGARNNNKRQLSDTSKECGSKGSASDAQHADDHETPPPAKTQIVGWPPVRSYRKNNLQPKKSEAEASGIYVKVSMDGAPYLRKIDLRIYKGYPELLKALENIFKFTIGEYSERDGYKGSEYAPTYEDKDGDWMLVGDVPWDMFMTSCKRLRIMKGSEARGLGGGV
ncbi:auxin-responsive protein IAA1 [Corylus avellana]|uniref:auxin-responsive protein IAA1 n=1 Tax=Corylus avellana TaxID=13451 RepID=UPI001E1F033B|nr:auxin-responsive protein IAA1 [Corylus avellana]